MSTSIRNPESQPDHFTVRLILTFFSLAAILLSIFAWNTIGQSTQPGLEMVLININHGDSILLHSTKGETALIDAGYPDAGTLKYLNEHTVKHLDLLIVTHHDEDHIGGIPEVLRALEVDTYIENGQVIDTDYFHELDKALQETGVRRKTVRTGDRIPFGELTLEVWNPSRARPDVVNNNSIVLFLQVGKVRFLLTGDIDLLTDGGSGFGYGQESSHRVQHVIEVPGGGDRPQFYICFTVQQLGYHRGDDCPG